MRRILVILATLMGATALAQANPTFPTLFGDDPDLSTIIVTALVAMALEFAVFLSLTAKVLPNVLVSLGIFLAIHLISLPLTQLAYMFTWEIPNLLGLRSRLLGTIASGVLAEAVPITIEALWYVWVIRRLYPGGITMKRAWTVSILANASSYTVGLAVTLFGLHGLWWRR
jgi:hypothetical protein